MSISNVKSEDLDKTLKKKIQKIMNDKELDIDPDLEMKIESFEFQGCIHENISPKDYDKKCKIIFFLKLNKFSF
jgi:hypothetical protein